MFTSGFFNSVNSDRKYNAEQMSAIFDGLITQGIFDSIGDHFQVTPGNDLTVSVGTGRAWLNQTWSYNDSLYPLQLSAASPTLGRKDLICIKVDKSNAVRANSIVLIEGTPASTPVEPTVTDDTTNGIYYHKLAAVTVPAGATSISAANIQNYIGLSTGTPYVTGIIETTAVDELWSQWDGEFNDWWENTIKPIINTETVTRLQNNIDHITPKETTMNLYGFSHLNPPPSGKTYQEYSTDAILNQISTLLSQKQPIGDYPLRSEVPKIMTGSVSIMSNGGWPAYTVYYSDMPTIVILLLQHRRTSNSTLGGFAIASPKTYTSAHISNPAGIHIPGTIVYGVNGNVYLLDPTGNETSFSTGITFYFQCDNTSYTYANLTAEFSSTGYYAAIY